MNVIKIINELAILLEVPIIAEGVELEEHAHFLKSIGCKFVQGYLFGKPIPSSEFIDLRKSVNYLDIIDVK